METFSALLAICAGNSPVPGEFPAQRPVTRSFHVFFDLRLNKPLSKQSWGWWFETLSRPLWRHCNDYTHGSRLSCLVCFNAAPFPNMHCIHCTTHAFTDILQGYLTGTGAIAWLRGNRVIAPKPVKQHWGIWVFDRMTNSKLIKEQQQIKTKRIFYA